MSGDHNMHCSANTGGPAYPTNNWEKMVPQTTGYHEGMTLRDYFAAKAMEAWILTTTKPYMHEGKHQVEMLDVDRVAEHAFAQADAMLKARQS